MQVNNSTSPNFGRLIVRRNPETEKALKQQTPQILEKMKECGNKMKNNEFFHVVADGKKLLLRSTPNAYFGKYYSNYYKDAIDYDATANTLLLGNVYGVHQLIGRDVDNFVEYNVWGIAKDPVNRYDQIETLTKLATELDGAAVDAYKKAVAAREAEDRYRQEVDTKVNDLFDNFGDDVEFED